MATITDLGFPTMADILSRMGPGGEVRPMVELLAKQLDIIEDIPWVQCNMETGHQISIRTGLPSPQWRRLNKGISITKTSSASYVETTGRIEDRAEVDSASPGDIAALRMSEEAGKVEMMTQEFARAFFYESTMDNADRIHGLTCRYGGTSGYTTSNYVYKPGTTSGVDAHSVWLLGFAPGKVYGLYPKNSVAGLKRQDLGEMDCHDSDGKPFRGYGTLLQWSCGVAVEDYRQAVRFQWDPGDTSNYADTAKGMYLHLQNMITMPFKRDGNMRFYMDRTTYQKLVAQLASNSADFLQYVSMGGRLVPTFLGIPIRITDALVLETAIS